MDLPTKTREAAAAVAADWLASRGSKGGLQTLAGFVLNEHGRETHEKAAVPELAVSLRDGHRIVLEAPPGAGKTITLIQIAICAGDGPGIPFLIDLPDWVSSKLDVLEYIASRKRFRALGIDANSLAALSESENYLFLLNGWNEVSNTQAADRVLSELARSFPASGIIVATRTRHTMPPLSYSFRVRLQPLSRAQRSEYLKEALGNQWDDLHGVITTDEALDELMRTPFILAQVTELFSRLRK